ncbi:MAG TPA: OpgC domain-containing protein [Gammaproteobacteria bacterium]
MERVKSLDFFRGLMLIIITVDHILTPEKSPLWQPLGYASAASGFVFLAGITTAIAYSRHVRQPGTLWRKCWQRSLVIYLSHVSLLALYYGWQAIELLMSPSPGSAQAMAAQALFSLALIHKPSLMDILPMYVIFMMAAPLLLVLINKGRHTAVLLASLLCWLLIQFINIPGPAWFSQYDLRIGAFNPLAWQFLFVAGLVSGTVFMRKPLNPPPSSTLAVLAVPVVLLLLDRHGIVDILPAYLLPLTERYNLGLIRLINFALLATLIYLSILYLKLNVGNRWVEFLGKHSLQVFTYSILLAEVSAKVLPYIQHYSGTPGVTLYLAASLISLSIPAFLHSRYRIKVKISRSRKKQSEVVTEKYA